MSFIFHILMLWFPWLCWPSQGWPVPRDSTQCICECVFQSHTIHSRPLSTYPNPCGQVTHGSPPITEPTDVIPTSWPRPAHCTSLVPVYRNHSTASFLSLCRLTALVLPHGPSTVWCDPSPWNWEHQTDSSMVVTSDLLA